jgi:hypothetical protein
MALSNSPWPTEMISQWIRTAGILHDLRQGGWMVACHNDYKLEGRQLTFWLFTNGIYCAKGEGPTDYDALLNVQARVTELKKDMG